MSFGYFLKIFSCFLLLFLNRNIWRSWRFNPKNSEKSAREFFSQVAAKYWFNPISALIHVLFPFRERKQRNYWSWARDREGKCAPYIILSKLAFGTDFHLIISILKRFFGQNPIWTEEKMRNKSLLSIMYFNFLICQKFS